MHMHIWQAVVLGIIQGVTEFLPVSSSGHLVLADHLLHISSNALALDTMLHLGTLVAVLFVYRHAAREMVADPFGRLSGLLLAATIPTVLIGLVFEKTFEQVFDSGATIGAEFVFTGALLLYTEAKAVPNPERSMSDMTWRGAVLVGLAQGAAIMPALSRSGLTLCATLAQGIRRPEAVRFSFLLSIPVILGATILQAREWDLTGGSISSALWWGMGASAVSGYVAIRLFTRFMANRRMNVFGVYTMTLGLAILADQLITHRFL